MSQRFYVPPHGARVQLTAYVRNGTTRVSVELDGEASQVSSGTLVGTSVTKITEIRTLTTPPTAGLEGVVKVSYQRTASQTYELYGWEIAIIPLQAGELPE